MLARLSLTGLATLTLLAFGGCKADTGGGGDGLAKDEAAEKFSEEVCASYYACDCTDFPPDIFTSEENCQAELEANILADIDTADAADLKYDEECAGRLLEWVDDLDCLSGSSIDLEDLGDFSAGLDCKVFYGDDEPGDSCERLDDNSDSCVQDAHCENGTCVADESLPDPGDSCETAFFSLCTGGSICIDIDGGQDHKCEILPKSGDTCLGTLDLCSEGLTCDQSSKKCVTAPGAGEECAMAVIDDCAEDLYCNASNECTALPTGGENCSDPGNACADGFACNGMGVCETEQPLVCFTALDLAG